MTASEPLPKPDKPGLYRVQWSNGETETVEVLEVTDAKTGETALQFWNPERSAHVYKVGDGHLAKWYPL